MSKLDAILFHHRKFHNKRGHKQHEVKSKQGDSVLSRRSEPGERHDDVRGQHCDCKRCPENEHHGRVGDFDGLATVPGEYNRKGNSDAEEEVEEWSAEAGGVSHPVGGNARVVGYDCLPARVRPNRLKHTCLGKPARAMDTSGTRSPMELPQARMVSPRMASERPNMTP